MISYDTCLSFSHFTYYDPLIAGHGMMSSFYGWVIWRRVRVPHLVYPFICPYPPRLLPGLSYCTWCCHERSMLLSLKLWCSLNLCPRMGLPGPMVLLCLVFLFLVYFLMSLCSVLLCRFTDFHSHQQGGEFFFLHTLSSIYFCRFFYADHSDPCEVIPHYISGSQFSNTYR